MTASSFFLYAMINTVFHNRLQNVNERIQLRFGKEYGLSYQSEEGKGTTVTYLLPYSTEEKENEKTKL